MSEFQQGYICAVSTLLRAHGEDTYCKELLSALGRVDWSKIDPYDRGALARAGLAPGRYKGEGA